MIGRLWNGIFFGILLLAFNFGSLNAQSTGKTERDFIGKYDFYTTLENSIPRGWKISVRDSNFVVYTTNVIIAQTPMKDPPLDPYLEEREAFKRQQPTNYEILLKLTHYPLQTYLNTQSNNERIVANDARLRKKYRIDEIPVEEGSNMYIAQNRDQKNRLVNYTIEKERLGSSIVELPAYYVKDYGVEIIAPEYYKLYPSKLNQEVPVLIRMIENVLLTD